MKSTATERKDKGAARSRKPEVAWAPRGSLPGGVARHMKGTMYKCKCASAVIAATMLVASCTNVLWVKERVAEGDKVKYRRIGGVPFYVKREQFKQTTVYAKTWLKSTLTVDRRVMDVRLGKELVLESSKQSFQRQLLSENSDRLSPIKLAIINARVESSEDAHQVIRNFEALRSICDDSTVRAVILKNVMESEWVVDEGQSTT